MAAPPGPRAAAVTLQGCSLPPPPSSQEGSGSHWLAGVAAQTHSASSAAASASTLVATPPLHPLRAPASIPDAAARRPALPAMPHLLPACCHLPLAPCSPGPLTGPAAAAVAAAVCARCSETEGLLLYPIGGGGRTTWRVQATSGSPADLVGKNSTIQVRPTPLPRRFQPCPALGAVACMLRCVCWSAALALFLLFCQLPLPAASRRRFLRPGCGPHTHALARASMCSAAPLTSCPPTLRVSGHGAHHRLYRPILPVRLRLLRHVICQHGRPGGVGDRGGQRRD